ncbi:MAG: ketol-acid reductoisomerase, partial [Chloroflexi bacterium]|nr:ketol-acid reductoisomerase [Chloroflexota bacterium]
MTATVYYDKDADKTRLDGKRVGIMGYGSQGHAHALNLRDNGVDVVVGLQAASKSREKAEAEGLRVTSAAEVAKESDVIMMLVPDTVQGALYKEAIEPSIDSSKTLMFAHGFNIHYKEIVPPPDVDVSMIAPKAPGHRMREVFVGGSGVPSLVAIHQDPSGNALANALAYGWGVGSMRAGIVATTFKEETETDLFGEQTVLCGGVSNLVKTAFETLVEAGYQPEIAYFEVCHELKLIVDLMYEGGLKYMRYSISETAEYGDYSRGPRVIDDHVRATMKQILAEIQDGTFAREWIAENHEGQPRFKAMREADANHEIEEVGERLREMMSFLKQ